MKVKLLTLVAAMFVLAATAFAQPAVVTLWIYDLNTNEPVMFENCADMPVPDGRLLAFYWDSNNNGPDDADARLGIYDESNPQIGAANYNTDRINGMEFLGVPGTYSPDSASLVIPLLPNPALLYARIYGADDMCVNQVTPVLTLTPGPQDHFVTATACNICQPPQECDPITESVELVPTDWNFPAPQTTSACLYLSDTAPTVITVPVYNATNVPQAHIEPGCANDPAGCTPAAGWVYDDNAWTYGDSPSPHFTNTIMRVGDGCCVTIVLDYILPVNGLSFAAVARDNSVDLTWTTVTETNLDKFVVTRDGARVTEVRANNVGSTYSYTDRNVENGTTYNYTIVAINLDGSQAATQTVEGVTPNLHNALVTEYALHQNYPNPFNPTTSIRLDLVDANFVTLKVYNANGQEVSTLVSANMAKGVNVVNFDAANLTSGLYFYTVKVGNVYSATKKMLLVK